MLCKHCGGDLEIRNPKGNCDHLKYPEYCPVCLKAEHDRLGYIAGYYEVRIAELEQEVKDLEECDRATRKTLGETRQELSSLKEENMKKKKEVTLITGKVISNKTVDGTQTIVHETTLIIPKDHVVISCDMCRFPRRVTKKDDSEVKFMELINKHGMA